MNRNLNRRIHPIAEADGLSPKKLVKKHYYVLLIRLLYTLLANLLKQNSKQNILYPILYGISKQPQKTLKNICRLK